jgi:hypothetical protein
MDEFKGMMVSQPIHLLGIDVFSGMLRSGLPATARRSHSQVGIYGGKAMTQISVAPVQWAKLPNMDTMNHDLDETDQSCLSAIREVLSKFGKLDRFGVMLLHKHFDISDHECLLEEVDLNQRTLTIRPVPKEDLGPTVQTQWSLAHNSPLQWCKLHCYYTGGTHTRPHQELPG